MLFREGRQKARSCFDQQDSGCPGIDAPEVTGQCLSRDFGYGARHLDTGGAAADDHECEQSLALGVVASELRFLKRGQNAATDSGRVFYALEARSDLGPTITTEIRISCSGCDHQEVKGEWASFCIYDSRPDINAVHLRHKYRRVFLSAQNMANWPGNIGGRQCSGRDLVEERVEIVIILPVYQGD